MRPGLILWIIIDLAFVAKQYHELGRVTDSIILTVAFHAWYVLDAEFNEVSLADLLPMCSLQWLNCFTLSLRRPSSPPWYVEQRRASSVHFGRY